MLALSLDPLSHLSPLKMTYIGAIVLSDKRHPTESSRESGCRSSEYKLLVRRNRSAVSKSPFAFLVE